VPLSTKIRLDGKFFALGSERFVMRGVTYGTFRSRDDGALFPERDAVKRDFALMREAGFNVVRTYTIPPDDVVDLAADWGLHLLPGVFYPDWRYLVGQSRREQRRIAVAARDATRVAARRFADVDHVLGLTLGNEIPADVIRWVGAARVASVLDELVDAVHTEDQHQLVTYANYPTAEYLPLESLDFLTFNVFLEQRADLRRYLTRLHHLAGDRPLVLGEVGLDAGTDDASEERQAAVLDWQLETATERGLAGTCVFSWTDDWWVGGRQVDGWHFGLTRADRSPRPALAVAQAWNGRGVADLSYDWPVMSVVVCAYNAGDTLDECLRHACALDYPDLEIIVVDDGSTDDTAEIARRHPRARLVTIEHAGLSVARNAGLDAATGDLIAYLDADAYPSPEWPYYLALGLDSPTVGGVGGPNLPPLDDAPGAHRVARAPGGPVHVLLTDDRAEHVPGCNMAFWKGALEEAGGFDPIYTSAGDDVDLCWKVLERWEIGFHPAALVWHHRRSGLRTYLRQQRGYGRAEALVEARHPDRFTSAGTARWRGSIYNSLVPRRGFRVYSGPFGTASYQSVYRGGGHTLDLLHQMGIPLAATFLLTAPLAAFHPLLGLPAVAAVVFVAALGLVDGARVRVPRHVPRRGFRAGVALLHLLQPLVRTWGRVRHAGRARRDLTAASLPGPVERIGRSVQLLPESGPRAALAADIVSVLRRAGFRIAASSGWDSYDARIVASRLLHAELVSSSHPEGWVQVAVRRRLRVMGLVESGFAVVALGLVMPTLAVAGALLVAARVSWAWWRTGPAVRRVIRAAAS
jgi:glycosyltransferase involved in cell wall biosynthesis